MSDNCIDFKLLRLAMPRIVMPLHRNLLLTPLLASLLAFSACQNDDSGTAVQSVPTATVAGFKGEFNINKAMDSQFSNHNQQFGWLWAQAKLRPMPAEKDSQWLTEWNNEDIALTPQVFHLLDSTHAVILADAQSLGEDGIPDAGHAAPGLIVALYFRNEKGQWILDGIPVGVTATGSFGYAGDIKLVDIGDGIKGFIVESGGTNQGYTSSSIDIFALLPSSIEPRPAAESILTAYSTCEESPDSWKDKGIKVPWLNAAGQIIIQVDHKHRQMTKADVDDEEEDTLPRICHDVETQWHFEKTSNPQYYDLVMQFKETAHEARDEANQSVPVINIPHKTARYQWRNGHYELIEGENPVPGI